MTEIQRVRLEIDEILHYVTVVNFGFYRIKKSENKTKEKIARLNYLIARLDKLEKEEKDV